MHIDYSSMVLFMLILRRLIIMLGYMQESIVLVVVIIELRHQICLFISVETIIHHFLRSIVLLAHQLLLLNSLHHHLSLLEALLDVEALQLEVALLTVPEHRLGDKAAANHVRDS